MLLSKGSKIDQYTVVFPIKTSSYAESYRVLLPNSRLGFLKLIGHSQLKSSQLDENGCAKEADLVKAVSHPNLCRFLASGQWQNEGEDYTYYVMEFVSSETLEERISRVRFMVNDVKSIAKAVLQALYALHTHHPRILHNDVTAQNILYDLMGDSGNVKLVNFGSASYASEQLNLPDIEETNPFYSAPERLVGICSVESDLYSVGVLIYHLLFGRLPWEVNLIDIPADQRASIINESRKLPLRLPNIPIPGVDEQLVNTLVKSLQYQPENRFHSAQEFIEAIDGIRFVKRESIAIQRGEFTETPAPVMNKAKGNGFADVAGMRELKEQLKSDVIALLNSPERAQALGLDIPNGILFYGPPGCGKTFFAEKFAEELKCNYMYIKCSDVASPYIHGGQEKIAAIFHEARQTAPCIVFLDEIDALLTHRDEHNNVSEAGEVNEFLAQINNCGKDKVLVVGATNKPQKIDEAALRAGRLELKYFIPLPDIETREHLFAIELGKRMSANSINYYRLAELTDEYSCADIKLVVDTAARIVFREGKDVIEEQNVLDALKTIKPSLSKNSIRAHLQIKNEFESRGENSYRPVGFRLPQNTEK